MKIKLFSFCLILMLFTSCFTTSLTKQDLKLFSISGNNVLYNDTVVAQYTHIEYEYYKNKRSVEICLDQKSIGATDMSHKIVDYVRSQHKNAKIELKIPQPK